MGHGNQQQTVAINRGLFLVRYAAAEDEAQPPKVMVTADRASKKDVSFLLHPDCKDAVLWKPEAGLVVRALAAGKLGLRVVPARAGGSIAATIKIEPLSQGKATTPRVKSDIKVIGAKRGLHILGHVSGLGDVMVNANEWLAGPTRPLRIEGISIDWPGRPADLELRYAAKTAKPQVSSGQIVGAGTFAGTRGKAIPIVALMLEISGPGAANFQLAVDAIFLGAPIRRIVGQRAVLSGPTGREPLVGLRVNLESLNRSDQPKTKSPVDKAPLAKPKRPASRVRVFRSREKSKQAATA